MIKLPPITVICLSVLILLSPLRNLLIVFFSIIIHEVGHLVTMVLMGSGIESITLLPVGIDIKRKEKYIPYPYEIILSLAGPVANVITFFVFGKYQFFAWTNLLYASINLLPVKGLDGGNALEAFLLLICPIDKAERIIKSVSCVFGILLWITGIYILLILNGNISIFALSLFLLISINMK